MLGTKAQLRSSHDRVRTQRAGSRSSRAGVKAGAESDLGSMAQRTIFNRRRVARARLESVSCVGGWRAIKIGRTWSWSGATRSFVMLNRYPYNNGHLLVAPRVHRGTLGELEGPDLLEPIETVQRMIAILDRMLQPQGYNIGLNQGKAAGAGLPGHLHWHIVPALGWRHEFHAHSGAHQGYCRKFARILRPTLRGIGSRPSVTRPNQELRSAAGERSASLPFLPRSTALPTGQKR